MTTLPVLAALGWLAAGCGTGGPPAAARATITTHPRASTSPTGGGSASTVAPVTTPTPADVAACVASQLRASTAVSQSAGYAWGAVIVTNDGTVACSIEGSPTVTSTTGAATQTLTAGSNPVMKAVTPARVVLDAAGGSTPAADTQAAFDLSAGPLGSGTVCDGNGAVLHVALPGGGGVVSVAAPFPTCTGEVYTAFYLEADAAAHTPTGS